jgi:hypothetical protein
MKQKTIDQLIKSGLMLHNENLSLDFNFVSQVERALDINSLKVLELIVEKLIHINQT